MISIVYRKKRSIYQYSVIEKQSKFENEVCKSWSVIVTKANDYKILYEEEVSVSMETAVMLVNTLADNEIEPEQTRYIVEDFIAEIHTSNIN